MTVFLDSSQEQDFLIGLVLVALPYFFFENEAVNA